MKITRYFNIQKIVGLWGVLFLIAPNLYAAQEGQYWRQEQTRLQQILMPGRDRDFYSAQLTELGYQITFAYIDPRYEEYDVVKDGLNYAVKIYLGPDRNEAVRVEVARDRFLSETTQRILETSTQTERVAREARTTEEEWQKTLPLGTKRR